MTFIVNKNLTFIEKVSMTFIEKIHKLAKEMLSAGIAGSKSGADASAQLLARIDQLETNLTRTQKEMAPVLLAALQYCRSEVSGQSVRSLR